MTFVFLSFLIFCRCLRRELVTNSETLVVVSRLLQLVDHANTFYQIPVGGNGIPVVFLHEYGQTRIGWQTTPDGREGWLDIFLRKGYSTFLVDQPCRGAAGSTDKIVIAPGDVFSNGTFKIGEQAWYTHFRIGCVAP